MITRKGALSTTLDTDTLDFSEPEIVGIGDLATTTDSIFSPVPVLPTKTLPASTSGALGIDPIFGEPGVVPPAANEIVGTNGNDDLYGTDGDDSILGLGGGDYLLGRAGDDELKGGDGNDILHGGADQDRLYGDDGIDYLQGGSGEDVLYGGAGFDYLEGGDGEDHLIGGNFTWWGFDDPSGDALYRGAGSDILDGGLGADEMWGGTGSDEYFVYDAGDLVVEVLGDPGDVDTVNTILATYTLPEYFENLHFTWTMGVGDFHGTGNEGANRISGDAYTDIIDGKGGDDVIYGSWGGDTLTGGAGRDVFKYGGMRDSYDELDIITDFTRGEDKIDLAEFWDIGGGHAYDDVFTPIGGGSFTAPGQVGWFYDASIHKTLVTANTDADLNTTEWVIYLNGNINLAASDFIL